MTEITAEHLNNLASKLDAVELTAEEQAVLHKVLERAAAFTPETVGFVASEDELIAAKGMFVDGGRTSEPPTVRAGLSPMALKLGSGAGLWG